MSILIRLCMIVGLLSASFVTPSQAAVRLVPAQYATIQAAIDAAEDGDEVIISAGVYEENLGIRANMSNLVAVTIRSTNPKDPAVVATTVIDGHLKEEPAIYVQNNPGKEVVIEGLTLRNGTSAGGGGLRVLGGSRVVARNNVFHNNKCTNYGGAVHVGSGSTVTLSGNEFYENTSIGGNQAGGAIGVVGNNATYGPSNAVIENNIIRNNTAVSYGGAIVFQNQSNGKVLGNRIFANQAENGGAIALMTGDVYATVNGNIVNENTANVAGGGIYVYPGAVVRNLADQPWPAVSQPEPTNQYSENKPQDVFFGTP
jgi:parallel beta-helix repeat protein/predicted outer membrane repeat protein